MDNDNTPTPVPLNIGGENITPPQGSSPSPPPHRIVGLQHGQDTPTPLTTHPTKALAKEKLARQGLFWARAGSMPAASPQRVVGRRPEFGRNANSLLPRQTPRFPQTGAPPNQAVPLGMARPYSRQQSLPPPPPPLSQRWPNDAPNFTGPAPPGPIKKPNGPEVAGVVQLPSVMWGMDASQLQSAAIAAAQRANFSNPMHFLRAPASQKDMKNMLPVHKELYHSNSIPGRGSRHGTTPIGGPRHPPAVQTFPYPPGGIPRRSWYSFMPQESLNPKIPDRGIRLPETVSGQLLPYFLEFIRTRPRPANHEIIMRDFYDNFWASLLANNPTMAIDDPFRAQAAEHLDLQFSILLQDIEFLYVTMTYMKDPSREIEPPRDLESYHIRCLPKPFERIMYLNGFKEALKYLDDATVGFDPRSEESIRNKPEDDFTRGAEKVMTALEYYTKTQAGWKIDDIRLAKRLRDEFDILYSNVIKYLRVSKSACVKICLHTPIDSMVKGSEKLLMKALQERAKKRSSLGGANNKVPASEMSPKNQQVSATAVSPENPAEHQMLVRNITPAKRKPEVTTAYVSAMEHGSPETPAPKRTRNKPDVVVTHPPGGVDVNSKHIPIGTLKGTTGDSGISSPHQSDNDDYDCSEKMKYGEISVGNAEEL